MKGTTGGVKDGKCGCTVAETTCSAKRMAAPKKEGRRLAMAKEGRRLAAAKKEGRRLATVEKEGKELGGDGEVRNRAATNNRKSHAAGEAEKAESTLRATGRSMDKEG